jgi:hypothetical protein
MADGCAPAEGLARIAHGDLRAYNVLAQQLCALRAARPSPSVAATGKRARPQPCVRFAEPTQMSRKVTDTLSHAFDSVFAVSCIAPQYLPLCALNLGSDGWVAAAGFDNGTAARHAEAAKLKLSAGDSRELCRTGCTSSRSTSPACAVMASIKRRAHMILHAAMEFLEPRGVPEKQKFRCTSHVFEVVRTCQRDELRTFFQGKGAKNPNPERLHDVVVHAILLAKANQYDKHPFTEDRY